MKSMRIQSPPIFSSWSPDLKYASPLKTRIQLRGHQLSGKLQQHFTRTRSREGERASMRGWTSSPRTAWASLWKQWGPAGGRQLGGGLHGSNAIEGVASGLRVIRDWSLTREWLLIRDWSPIVMANTTPLWRLFSI